MDEKRRCSWAGDVPVYVDYHDNEWGRPTHDDRMLFELLVLEGAQAGLSWLTILKKREAYREAFDGFDPAKVALYDEAKVEELMANEGIVRNRLKINAAVTNAKLFLDVAREFGSFDAFIWGYVDGEPIVNRWKTQADVPANHAAFRPHQQGSQEARLQVRRLHHRVCLPAIHRHRERPRGRLLCVPGAYVVRMVRPPSSWRAFES